MKSTVRDVMTAEVITVEPSTTYTDIVDTLRRSGISAVPVRDPSGFLLGIVSEADLLLKEEFPSGRRRRFRRGRRAENRKAAATQASQLMTTPVVTVGPDEPVGTAARIMHQRGVKRLAVVDGENRLVGIVSRQDLLSVFLRSDEEIRREIIHDIIERRLWLTPEEADLRVRVEKGVAELEGRIDRKSTLRILVGLVLGVEGVVAFENRVRYDTDDTHIRPVAYAGILPYSLRDR